MIFSGLPPHIQALRTDSLTLLFCLLATKAKAERALAHDRHFEKSKLT